MILRHLRANAVAFLALFLALTSTSYAAVQLANGSVTTKKLAKDAVTSPKIKARAVSGADLALNAVDGTHVRNGSLAAADLAPGTLPQADFLLVAPGGTNPVLVPDAPAAVTKTVSVPRAGDLLVRLDLGAAAFNCTSGNSTYGLYADGSPVPGTSGLGPATADRRDVAVSAVVAVSAGSHTFTLGVDCSSGSISGLNSAVPAMWTFALNGP